MIAASEPLEFVPHGRRALSRHPGSVLRSASGVNQCASDVVLLNKLKNVAISDRSEHALFMKSLDVDASREWWNIRQICVTKHNDSRNEDGYDSKTAKEKKPVSNVTPNIKLKNDYNASIRCEMNSSKRLRIESNTNNQVHNDDVGDSETYEPDLKVDCCYEEELFIKDKTAIWSRGLASNVDYNDSESRVTVTSYTCETPIKHALFCKFHPAVNDRFMLDALNTLNSEVKPSVKVKNDFEEVTLDPIPSICIIDSTCLRAFTESGEDYITNLQFQVKSVWSTKYGILLEKEAVPAYHSTSLYKSGIPNYSHSVGNHISLGSTTKMSSNIFSPDCGSVSTVIEPDLPLPTCFSLSHPLDEMSPILTKSSPFGVQYYNDGNMQIVFVCDEPSLALTYNKKSALHSLWKVRKATSEECRIICSNWNKTSTMFNQSINLNFGNSTSPFDISMQKGFPSVSIQRNSTPSCIKTNDSKMNSPMAGMFSKLGLTPHTTSTLGATSNNSMHTTNANAPAHPQPIFPDICFEHIWTENHGVQRSNSSEWSAAVKAFLHCDHIGQHYLCYLIGGNIKQLFIAKIEKLISSDKPIIIMGVVTSIPAKDAVNIVSSNLIALIDPSGNIILYSGLFMIGKVHIGGVLAGLINSPYNQTKKMDTSFPRRSSLLPMSMKDPGIFDDSALHQLSPVPHKASKDKNLDYSGLIGLRDAVGNRVTLEYDRGLYYRIALPELASSSLVLKCIQTLKQILPKDIMMQVISKWYGIRNSPGTRDLSSKLEWSMFVTLIFNLLGYDISKLTLTKQPDIGNMEIMTKKQKTSNDGSQYDWEYLLNSAHHVSFGNSLATMLHLKSEIGSGGRSINTFESNSTVHQRLTRLGKLNHSEMDTTSQDYSTSASHNNVHFNSNSLLFPFMLQILFSLHLLYEEMKLNVLLLENLQPLAQFLYQLSIDLRLEEYTLHYWKDFPDVCSLNVDVSQQCQVSEHDFRKITQPTYFEVTPASIFEYLFLLVRGLRSNSVYPYIEKVNKETRDIIEIVGLISNGQPGQVQALGPKEGLNISSYPNPQQNETIYNTMTNMNESAVLMISKKGYTLRDIQNFPPAINSYILNTLSICKTSPPADWPHQAYSLIMREDLSLQVKLTEQPSPGNDDEVMKENAFSVHKLSDDSPSVNVKIGDGDKNTGFEHIDTKILRLRFPNDHRVTEMCSLLQSSLPVTIALTQRPEVSDHDFIEEQERHLYALCTRTMALPLGRGMVTLRSSPCIVTEPLHIPKLCLTGRAPPRNATIELSHIEVPPHYSAWPLFHNGVAAGLKLVPMGTTKIDSAWIVYNKPKQGTADMLYEHAGFLMALGLNGHLKDMAFMDIYDYLVKSHEMTSVGLLLGIAATYRGTMDISTTKMMSIHVEALLPPTSIELDIPQNVQVAALLGVGLLYQRTAHTHITQVLLSEIGRPPGPEMENSSEREGYALAAGLGLGLVCLGSHQTVPHHLTSTLRHYMLGGNKRPLTGAQKEKYKLPSFQIREGPTVNVDVTAPGATLALGMLYLKSGNTEVAKWLAPPPTHYLLDFVRPDLLLLRVIARGLILWDSIEPSEEWVENYVPASVKPYCFVKPTEDHIDYEAMNQVYCNIVAGACFSIGLRFAGSANLDACNTILYYAKEFTKLGSKSIGELAGKSTIETCLNLLLISAAMVMAGTGDLQIMRLCRQQRSRAGPTASSLTYGSQLAVHSALGLLFLGAGRFTLSTSPESIAALICSFFPKFPTHSNDNRYHLQAFRHLYVLAAEPRLIIPRDINSGSLCYVNVKIIKLTSEEIEYMRAPCILPELHTLKEVHIEDPRYWPIVFKRDMNWDQLMIMQKNLSCIDIKQRAGSLSYIEDPYGFQSLLAQMLTTEKTNVWSAKLENIFAFTNDPTVLNFTRHYLVDPTNDQSASSKDSPIATKSEKSETLGVKLCGSCYFLKVKNLLSEKEISMNAYKKCMCDRNSVEENEFVHQLAMATYESVIRDTIVVLPIWITFLKILKDLKTTPNSYHVWQLKLLFAQIDNFNRKVTYATPDREWKRTSEYLISNEFSLSMKQTLTHLMDGWMPDLKERLLRYLKGSTPALVDGADAKKFASFVTFYSLSKGLLKNVSGESISVIDFLADAATMNMDPLCVEKILDLLKDDRGTV